MKTKIYLTFFSIIFIVSSCKKEENQQILIAENRSVGTDDTRNNISECSYTLERMDEILKFQVLLSKFIGMSIANEHFKKYLVEKLYTGSEKDPESSELFFAETQNDMILQPDGSSISIRSMFENWLLQQNQSTLLLDKLCSTFSETVIAMPWWIYSIATTKDQLLTMTLGSAPDVLLNCNTKEGVLLQSGLDIQFIEKGTAFKGVLPLFIKSTELFMKKDPNVTHEEFHKEVVKKYFGIYPGCSITQNELSEFMKTIDCTNLTAVDLKKLNIFIKSNCTLALIEDCTNGLDDDGDGLIDGADPDCKPKEICNNGKDDDGDGLIDSSDPDCPCVVVCERDCKQEKNFLEGMRFAGPHMFTITNQLFSESTTRVSYQFFGVSICNPQVNMAPCPPNSINDRIIDLSGFTQDFWLMQKFSIRSDDNQSTWPEVGVNGVVYVIKRPGQGFCDDECWYDYWKAWPKYFDTKVPYLTNFISHWNGDLIGDKIKFLVHEQDEYTTSISISQSVTSTVSQNMTQTNTPQGENNGTGSSTSYSFSTGISNTSSVTLSQVYQKDIFCGEYNLFYCDPRINNPDPWNPTGIWYGHIPNNYPGVSIYNHFNYE